MTPEQRKEHNRAWDAFCARFPLLPKTPLAAPPARPAPAALGNPTPPPLRAPAPAAEARKL